MKAEPTLNHKLRNLKRKKWLTQIERELLYETEAKPNAFELSRKIANRIDKFISDLPKEEIIALAKAAHKEEINAIDYGETLDALEKALNTIHELIQIFPGYAVAATIEEKLKV